MTDEHVDLPVVEAPAVVVVPPVYAQATTTREQDLEAESRRAMAERIAPRTTEEEDRRSAGQRAINLTWENTQRLIALSVTWVSLTVAAWLAVMGATESVQTAALVFVFGVANLVIGFYFGRTNHQRSGGVGGDMAGPR